LVAFDQLAQVGRQFDSGGPATCNPQVELA